MKRKDINSKEDGITKDMQPAPVKVRSFRFPKLGVVVEAEDYSEALKKAKQLKK